MCLVVSVLSERRACVWERCGGAPCFGVRMTAHPASLLLFLCPCPGLKNNREAGGNLFFVFNICMDFDFSVCSVFFRLLNSRLQRLGLPRLLSEVTFRFWAKRVF